MKIAISVCSVAVLLATQAAAADMPLKPPPPAAAASYSWTGFYLGGEVGGGWGDKALNYSANDPVAASLVNGGTPALPGFPGQQPLPNVGISQAGAVGGFEVGYNWQFSSEWLLGIEADFSFSGIRGHASGTSFLSPVTLVTNTINAEQNTDWYGTVRGRAGWLATPNLLLFVTGGFAYGRVGDSANYVFGPAAGGTFVTVGPTTSFACVATVRCFAGASSALRTGWTAGGGAEWLFDQHWSIKVEYQLVDLGTETERLTALSAFAAPGVPQSPASFNALFREQIQVVRAGLNYKF